MQSEWQFVQRVVKGCGSIFAPLEAAITKQFLPALLDGKQPTADERELYSLPVRYGGMGIGVPTATADTSFDISRAAAEHLVAAIKGVSEFNIAAHQQCGRDARAKHKADKKVQLDQQSATLFKRLPTEQARAAVRAAESKNRGDTVRMRGRGRGGGEREERG